MKLNVFLTFMVHKFSPMIIEAYDTHRTSSSVYNISHLGFAIMIILIMHQKYRYMSNLQYLTYNDPT